MLTTDGDEIEWPFSNERTVSLSTAMLMKLRDRSALVRVMAHEKLTDFQLVKLYRPRSRPRAMKMRNAARVIAKFSLQRLCFGIGECRITGTVLMRTNDPNEIREALVALPFNEQRYKEDKEAFDGRQDDRAHSQNA